MRCSLSMPFVFAFLFVAAALLGAGSAAAKTAVPHRVPLAVTLDDLPFVGPPPPGKTRQQALASIVNVLRRRGVPAVGFFVCQHLERSTADAIPWLGAPANARLEVANHSWSHRSVDDLGPAGFLADVRRCRTKLEQTTGTAPRFFRFPMLRTGASIEKRDRVLRGLQTMNQERAPVTVDVADWVLARPYVEALDQGDQARADAIADAYLEHVRRSARHYRRVAKQRVGRDISQVLILHANALAADHLGRALAMLENEGFQFVSLSAAMQDPVYDEADVWVDEVGASWLYRLAPADTEAWGWDQGQERAMRARFKLRSAPDETEFFRIGPDLVAHPLALPQKRGSRAFVIEHKEPISANALLLVTPKGVPILADTPWTPQATHDLLDWIALRFGRPVALATIGHYHLDASGGVAALREEGVAVVASSHTAELLAKKGPGMRATLAKQHGEGFRGWKVSAPSQIFSEEAGYQSLVGWTRVEVLAPGAGHSPDNVVTWFPHEKLLFGGCMVKGGKDLGWLGDADLASWPAAHAALMTLGARVVVPGHGRRTDAGLLKHTAKLLQAKSAE